MISKLFSTVCLLAIAHPGFLQSADDLKPYPAAAEGQVRHVVRLPVLEEEQERNRLVEILVSKVEKLDLANQYFYGGTIAEKTVEGWGYSYYEVTEVGPLAGTRMAVPEFAPKVDRSVPLRSSLGLVRYNSKLPVVVYAPVGFDVAVRVWTAGEGIEATAE